MIHGVVTAEREALIHFRVSGPLMADMPIEAILDTGFTEFLTLPPSVVDRLGLPFIAPTAATLADGRTVQMHYHRGTIIWDGERRDVFILASDGGPLIGMSMLYGFDVHIQAIDGGAVTITRRG